MISVKVSYSVRDNFINENKKNILKFLNECKHLDKNQFTYTVLQGNEINKNTFIHISQYKNVDIQHQLLNLPAFLFFQSKRDENLTSKPSIEFLNYVGSTNQVIS